MIRSMTAFARHESMDEQGTLVLELRSVNHRYLEIFMRLPEEFRGLEPQLRERVMNTLARGKIECILSYKPSAVYANQVIVNEELANAVVEATHKVEDIMKNPARIDAIEILQWPGVTREPERDIAPLFVSVLSVFDRALVELVQGREREGIRLKAIIEQRSDAVRELVLHVRKRRPQVITTLREKLQARIAELNLEPDNNRLEQELAYYAQKLDVEEELDRLDSHCKELTSILKRNDPVGRRLDFLMQEFHREANTLSSKSADLKTTRAAVELKVLIEQMREQIQNIE
jgi:uncharacterized protein (TIGR00255 family)